MKIILEDFNYQGMHFDQIVFDFPELGDVYTEDMDIEITDKIIEKLNQEVFGETEKRG